MDPARWSLLFGALAGLGLLLLWPVKVEVDYRRREAEGEVLHLTFALPGKRLSWQWHDTFLFLGKHSGKGRGLAEVNVPRPLTVRSFGRRGPAVYPLVKGALRLWQRLASVWGRFLTGTRCQGFRCIVQVGTGDPASTGVFTGLLWNLLGFWLQNLKRQTRSRFRPELAVIPCFEGPCWRAEFSCRLAFPVARLILAGLQSAFLLWKTVRGIQK
ncbi:MAG TPA: hypothetical protein DEA73_09105 [Peptococcaceae bacterium]|nr:MAG: Uncharacterized protein XD51_0585 [Moorella sp. 60_41]HBT48010.1 hypothetical protein [Peptococcaceae bacterium]